MNTPKISWFDIASQKMDWLTTRQKVISENVANADTPGYVGRDVSSFADHLDRAHDGERNEVEVSEASNSWAGSFDGNSVVLEEQAVLSAQTAGDFNLAAKLYRKGYSLIGIAAGKR